MIAAIEAGSIVLLDGPCKHALSPLDALRLAMSIQAAYIHIRALEAATCRDVIFLVGDMPPAQSPNEPGNGR